MALLTICLACSTFMIVLLFRELRAPFTKQRGGKVPKQRTEAKRLARSGRNGSHAGVTQAFRGAKRASGDRRRGVYSPGRGNLVLANKGEYAKESARLAVDESTKGFAVSRQRLHATLRDIGMARTPVRFRTCQRCALRLWACFLFRTACSRHC